MADFKPSDKRHPLYDENLDSWTLFRDSVKGGETFITDANLYSHRLEDSTDYDERLERAYFLNFCDTIPQTYNSYIFKEHIERPSDPVLEFFRKDCDGRGNSLTEFIKKAGYFASVYGVVHILISTPPKPTTTSGIITKAQEKELNIQPRCSIILPTELVDWSIDDNGKFRWVLIQNTYYRDVDPTIDRSTETQYRLITREDWKILTEDGETFKFDEGEESAGTNELGEIAIVSLYHKNIDDNKIGESLLKDIVYINRAILNWCSCIDEQIERQTFSQLVVPDDGTLADEAESGRDPLHQIGTSSIWTFSGDANHPPAFISPNVENIQTIWKLVVDHIKEIYRLARLMGSSEDMYASSSGRSAQMGFMSVNSALADKAQSYQKAENEISKFAYIILGQSDVSGYVDVKYPDTFDVAVLSEELDSHIKVMERNFSPTLNKEMQKNIARRSLPLASQIVKAAIEGEIDSGDGRVEPLTGAGTADEDVEKDGQGNTNTRLGDTHGTKADLDKRESQKRSNADLEEK